MINAYAGIGSRETPQHILNIISHIGSYLATRNWVLRSGAASGADTEFENGCDRVNGTKEIYLPWKGFNHSKSLYHPEKFPFTTKEMALARASHPAWDRCSPGAQKLLTRNVRQLLGIESLQAEPVKMVICWTEHGALKGGTAQALRIAMSMGIPIINLGSATNPAELEHQVVGVDKFVEKYNV